MLTWIIGGLTLWALGFLFLLVLMRMAGDQDRAARHEEFLMNPLSDVPITRFGSS